MSLCRQNFDATCEGAINEQINLELYASYTYQVAARYFERDDVALPGFARLFQQQSNEERGHAESLQKYLNLRGGRLQVTDIEAPPTTYASPLMAMEAALELEKDVNKALLALHKAADAAHDPHLTEFIESNFLKEQAASLKELSDYITMLRRVGVGLGEYMLDEKLATRLE